MVKYHRKSEMSMREIAKEEKQKQPASKGDGIAPQSSMGSLVTRHRNIVDNKMTTKEVPADIRSKPVNLNAGLKIRKREEEHQKLG